MRANNHQAIPTPQPMVHQLVVGILTVLFLGVALPSQGEPHVFPDNIKCEGDYTGHLQGVCTDDAKAIFWSFTTVLVKTDEHGKILKKIEVASHHGDLCFSDGRLYVAVNLGQFNNAEGKASSWVYVYNANTLELIAKHATPEVFHGAGGIGVREGHFYVVGGLPKGVEENYVYEYDGAFNFIKKHSVKSGWTNVGIQSVTFHDGAWWFGCYGSPKITLKTDADFNMIGRYEFDCALGVVGMGKGKFLVAKGPRTPENRCMGTLHHARPDEKHGLAFVGKVKE